jgi:hypothetical protein
MPGVHVRQARRSGPERALLVEEQRSEGSCQRLLRFRCPLTGRGWRADAV